MAKVGRLANELIVQELTTALRERPSFFVASVGRLSATDADTLRKRLRGSQSRLVMIKRRLGLQSLSALKLDGATGFFAGSIVLVLPGENVVPAAKLLVDMAKADGEKLTVRGGLVEGQVLDKQGVEHVANLPSKPQLIAQLIGVIESPIAQVVMTVESVLSELAYILDEASKNTPAASAADTAPTQSSATGTESDAAPSAEKSDTGGTAQAAA